MSNTAITYLVAAFAAVFSLAAFTAWVLVPAWTAYTRTSHRLAAAVLSIYVLVAFIEVGILAGAGIVYFWDRIT